MANKKQNQITLSSNGELWKEGSLRVGKSIFHFWAKVYDLPSEFGIREGRISKLTLKRNDTIVCNFDRGWDIKPVDDDTKAALEILLYSYK